MKFKPFKQTAIAAAIGLSIAVPVTAQELVLEEIVVTAQKREESLTDIAATVNVIGGKAVDDYSVFNFNDIEQLTAGLSLNVQNARSANVSLRGISNDPESGGEAGVDLYLNDVLVRPDTAFSQLYDLDGIEILRGPQGALQGRTSPGGAIIMKTKKASVSEGDGSIALTLTDDEGFNTQLAVGGPIIDGVLGARVAVVFDQNDVNGVTNLQTGLDTEEQASGARFSLRWEPTDSISMDLVHQYYERETDDPKILDGRDLRADLANPPTDLLRPTLSAEDRNAIAMTDDFVELRYDITTLDISMEAFGHDLTILGGYQTSDKLSMQDNDRAGFVQLPLIAAQSSNTVVESKTVEARISSVDSEKWEYMVGLYYLDQDTDTVFRNRSVVAGGINLVTEGPIPVNSENLALFTFNTFHFNEQWSLDVGARWQKRNSFRKATVFFGGIPYLDPAFAPFLAQIEAAFAAPLVGVLPENEYGSSTNVTGMVSLAYAWDDDSSAFFSVSRANRADGVSISPGPNIEAIAALDLLEYESEESTNFEIGFKTRLWDGRASLNGAVFYQQFDGFQARVTGLQVDSNANPADPDLTDVPGGLVFNADATVLGAELDGQVLLSEQWSLGGSLSFSQAEFDDGETSPCNDRLAGETIGRCDIGGTPISPEPELSVSLNSEYFVPMGGSEFFVRGLLKHNGERTNLSGSAGIGNVEAKFDSYTTVNLFAGLRGSDGNWELSVWAKNLTDEDAVIVQEGPDANDLTISGGSYVRNQLIKERTIGLTGKYNFSF